MRRGVNESGVFAFEKKKKKRKIKLLFFWAVSHTFFGVEVMTTPHHACGNVGETKKRHLFGLFLTPLLVMCGGKKKKNAR